MTGLPTAPLDRGITHSSVLRETMLAVYRRGATERGGRVGFLTLAANGHVTAHHSGAFALPGDPEAPWLLPRAPDQVALTDACARCRIGWPIMATAFRPGHWCGTVTSRNRAR